MKIALIGLGDIAVKAHLPVLTQMENVEWVFCTRNPERLQQLAKKYHVKESYTDYRDLAKAGRCCHDPQCYVFTSYVSRVFPETWCSCLC